MGSSEEEESGMESGVDTYSRSSSRRETREDFLRALQGGDVANVRGEERVVQDEHIKDGEGSKEEETGSKRKRRESSSDSKRQRVCENPRQLDSKADSENNMRADGRACQVENSDQMTENSSDQVLTPLKKSHLLALNAQVLISPKPNKVPKTPSKSKVPIPNCIQKKTKKFKGSNTTYYYHSCDDFNYEDMKQVNIYQTVLVIWLVDEYFNPLCSLKYRVIFKTFPP